MKLKIKFELLLGRQRQDDSASHPYTKDPELNSYLGQYVMLLLHQPLKMYTWSSWSTVSHGTTKAALFIPCPTSLETPRISTKFLKR